MSQINSVGGNRNGVAIDAAGDVSTSGPRASTPATLMPEPTGGSDIGFLIAKLTIENAFESRKTAREDKQSAMRTMVAAQDAQVKELHKQAEENFKAAQLQAFGQMASGICGIGSGLLAAQGAANEARDLQSISASRQSNGVYSPDNAKDVVKATAQRDASYASALKSVGDAGAGALNFAASFSKKSADEAGARAKAAENQASIAKMAVDDASDEVKEARQHVNTALDFLRQFNETQTKSMAAAIRA